MVVEPFNAHDDYGDDCARNDRRTTTISQAVSQSWNTRELHARVLSLDAHNLLRKRRLGVPRDGCVNAAATDRVLRGAANVLHDSIFRRGNAEQLRLG